jgi:AcrR family transcriptional regulator
MPTHRSSAGDPARTLQLLWRQTGERGARRGPRQALSIDQIVAAATSLADRASLDAVTMRRVADELGVATMTLYTYVPGKAELLDLMLDAAYHRMPRTEHGTRPWRERVAAVAGDNRELFARHPWAATVATTRPPLGPGLMAKYEHELRAFENTGLDDVEMDAALTFVLQFVRAGALAEAEAAAALTDSAVDDEQWWAANAPLLERVFDATKFPTAARVGAAAGAAYGGAYSPAHAYAFGLQRVLDGLAALIDRPDRRSFGHPGRSPADHRERSPADQQDQPGADQGHPPVARET